MEAANLYPESQALTITFDADTVRQLQDRATRLKRELNTLIEEILRLYLLPSFNPSPSGDPWFDDPENMAIFLRGVEEERQGLSTEHTIEELREMIGLPDN